MSADDKAFLRLLADVLDMPHAEVLAIYAKIYGSV